MKAILLNNYLSSIVPALLLTFSIFLCNNSYAQVNSSALPFEEIKFSIEQVDNYDGKLEYKFISDGLDLKLNIDTEKEASLLSIDDKIVLTDFNYFYNTDLKSSIEEIKILKQSDHKDIVILLPTFTEEFLAFQVIKFESISGTFKNGFFEINTHEYTNVRKFYLDNEIILTQSNDDFTISLGDFQYKNVFTDN